MDDWFFLYNRAIHLFGLSLMSLDRDRLRKLVEEMER